MYDRRSFFNIYKFNYMLYYSSDSVLSYYIPYICHMYRYMQMITSKGKYTCNFSCWILHNCSCFSFIFLGHNKSRQTTQTLNTSTYPNVHIHICIHIHVHMNYTKFSFNDYVFVVILNTLISIETMYWFTLFFW